MNDDTVYKIEGTGIKIIKSTIVFTISIIILGLFFWLTFYSVFLANISFIISVRGWYQEVYWKAEGLISKSQRGYPPFNPIYIFSVDGIDDSGNYIYSYWGTYLNINKEQDTVVLKGSDNKSYSFTNKNSIVHAEPQSFPVILIQNGNYFDPKTNPTASIQNFLTLKNPHEGMLFQIRWSDKRTLSQIIYDYNSNQTDAINKNSSSSVYILAYE